MVYSQHSNHDRQNSLIYAFFGCIISWLLIEISPSKYDPRSLNTLIPVASALLCATLSRLADQSAESHKLAQTKASIRMENLEIALKAYSKYASNTSQEISDKPSKLDHLKEFPFKMIIHWDKFPLTLLLLAICAEIWSTDCSIKMAGVAIILALTAISMQIIMIESSSDNQVKGLTHGESDRSYPEPLISIMILILILTSLTLATVSIYLWIPMTLLSGASIAICCTVDQDKKYLAYIHRKLESRAKSAREFATHRPFNNAQKFLRPSRSMPHKGTRRNARIQQNKRPRNR